MDIKKLHLILDIDGTLIDDKGLLEPRLYLKEFLKYAFDNFKTVSIWTAAHESWYKEVHNCSWNNIINNRWNKNIKKSKKINYACLPNH